MDVTLIILVFGLILIFFLFLKLLKSVLKALGVVLMVFLIIGLVLGSMIYTDITNFQKLASGKKVILFQDEVFKAGIGIPPITNVNDVLIRGAITHYYDSDFETFNELYSDKAYDNITPENGVLIIVLSDALSNTSTIEIGGMNITISKNDFLDIVNSKTTDEQIDILTKNLDAGEKLKAEEYITYNFDSAQKVKNFLFYKIFTGSESDLGNFLLENLRKNTIEVYPEFITFKSISFIPLSLKDITGKIIAEDS